MRIGDKVETGAPYTPQWRHGRVVGFDKMHADEHITRVVWAECPMRPEAVFDHVELRPFDGRSKTENDSPSEAVERGPIPQVLAMKVKEKNDWEALTYFANGVELRPDTHSHARIRFPDGTEEVRRIHWRTESRNYWRKMADHNHRETVDSQVPYIRVDYFGVEVQIKLTLVEVIL